MARSTVPMTATDRAEAVAQRNDVPPPSWKPILRDSVLGVVAVALIVLAFVTMNSSSQSSGGAPVLAAVGMLVIGCINIAIVVLRLPSAFAFRRHVHEERAAWDAALASGSVHVLTLHVTQAWLVPWADVDIEPPLLLVGDDGTCVSLIYPPESVALRVEREEEFHTLVFARVTLRLTQTKPPRLLSAVGEGPQFIAADTKATWPDDYEKFFLPSGTDEVGVFNVNELTPAWRELVERSTRA